MSLILSEEAQPEHCATALSEVNHIFFRCLMLYKEPADSELSEETNHHKQAEKNYKLLPR